MAEHCFVKVKWTRVCGDLNDPLNMKKVNCVDLSGRFIFKKEDGETRTFRQIIKPSDSFSQTWRLFFAGKNLSWDDVVPENIVNNHLHLVARIGHWSSKEYQENDPIKLFS